MFLLSAHALVVAAATATTAVRECTDLTGTWRMADVNPSAQYIASVTPGELHRYRVSRGGNEHEYVVACQSGACMHQPNATLAVNPQLNGTVRLATQPQPPPPPQQQQQQRRSPGKCKALLGTQWFLDRDGGEAYAIEQDDTGPTASHFNVTCVKGPSSPCTSWQAATGTLHVETQMVAVVFNTGGSQTGSLTPDCKRVYWCPQPSGCKNLWCEKSECAQSGPPAPAPPPQEGVLSVRDKCHAIFWRDPDGTNGGTSGGPAWFREVEQPPSNITVHIVPHSHLDPGWLYTVEAMYKGAQGFTNSGDKGPLSPAASKGIQALITQMVAGVAAGKTRTFAPEIGVFYDMWWKDANATQRDTVRQLVKEGRLEWTGGGWTQHDEACSRIEDQVDNLCLGHLWLKSVVEYDSSPWSAVRTAWQPDPFGHSSTAAYLFKQSGFDFYGFGRGETEGDPINQQTAALWHAMKSFPDTGQDDRYTMLTHEQRTGYWNPYRSNHANLLDKNAEAVADDLILLSNDLAATAHPAVSNVIIMFGDDHRWEDAQAVYDGLDGAIAAINRRTPTTGVRAHYSTPSRYAKSLNAEQIEFPSRPAEWDMLPLIGDEMGAPWSGFFTSRPGFKSLVRASSSLWRSAQQLHALTQDSEQWMSQFAELLPLWKAMGLAVAHDALPGDGFAIVSNDFTNRLKDGMERAANVASAAGEKLSGCGQGMTPCTNATGELCDGIKRSLTDGKPSLLSVYNPQMSHRDEFIELLVPSTVAKAGLTVAVADSRTHLQCQLTGSHMVEGAMLLTFKASLLPLGMHHFVIEPTTTADTASCEQVQAMPLSGERIVLGGGAMALVFNSSGALQAITARNGSTAIDATARVLSYQTAEKTENSWDFSTNGKGGESAAPFPGESSQTGTIARGSLFSEVVTKVDQQAGVTVRYRLFAGADHAHVFVSSGPFDVSHHLDQNVILRFQTNISSGTRMLTDSNGLEWIPRERDQRPWQVGPWFNAREPVSSNYYPATLAAILPSTTFGRNGRGPALSIVVGSAQGAASIADGSIEVMINRAVLDPSQTSGPNCDNSTDNHLVTLHNMLVLSDTSDPDGAELAGSVRPLAAAVANPVVLFSQPHHEGSRCTARSPISTALPPQLELLSLQMLPPSMNISLIDDPATQYNSTTAGSRYPAPPVGSAVMLLRLRHLYAAGDAGQSSPLGKPVKLDLAKIFAPHWTITDVNETTLSGSMTLSQQQSSQLHWRQAPAAEGGAPNAPTEPRQRGADSADSPGVVTIRPMEVRTWAIRVASAAH